MSGEVVKKESEDFHTKYRPKNFDEVLGNKQLVRGMKTLLARGEFPHTVLLHGPLGCGKTSIAKIIASELESSMFSFDELDNAAYRGIESVRELIRKVEYTPMEGKTKVVLMDECHKLTSDAQSALLKTLEHPPPHAYFILCTTDPEKLIPTVLSRCTKYEVEHLKDKHIMILLDRVLQAENIVMKDKVREMIVQRAEGCVRESLVLLKQVIFLPEKRQVKAVVSFKTNKRKVIDLCRAILKKEDWSIIAKIIEGIEEEPESVRRAVLGYVNSVMLRKASAGCMMIYMAFKEPFFNVGKAGVTFSAYKATQY